MKQVRKMLVGAVGFIAILSAQGVLPSPWDKYAAAAVAVAGIYGIYKVPNDPAA